MSTGQRGPNRAPGDLYLDPAVPERERVTVSCGEWLAQASHVWTGTGWSRLGPSPVHPVPGAAAVPDTEQVQHVLALPVQARRAVADDLQPVGPG